jgi:Family of unknown function (DUF5989)
MNASVATAMHWIKGPTRPIAGHHIAAILGAVTMSTIVELWQFMRERKKFWLLPIVVLMLVFSGLVVLTKGTAIAPFIYTIF